MTEDLFSGANVIVSIKATHEIRDDSGFRTLEKTKGELVLTEKEFVFLEVKGTFKKEKTRKYAFPIEALTGHSYERWSGGPTTLYLSYDTDSGTKTLIFSVSKGDYDKFIGTVKERRIF
ncbi:MAG: hypothetical protein ACFE9D_01800 [Promethearchaeota archaeon]